jgi:hypothetical protein
MMLAIDDHAMPSAGDQVSVGDRAKAAIQTLERQRQPAIGRPPTALDLASWRALLR